MINEVKNIGFYQIGDTFQILLNTVNNSCKNRITDEITMTITLPPGIALDSYDVPKGVFSILDNTWTLESILPLTTVEGLFTFRILEDCHSSFLIKFDIEVENSCNDCFQTPNYCVDVRGLSCCSLLPCLEGLVVNSNKFVDEGLNITEVDPGVALTPGQILFVSVNGFEVDYQDDALAGYMSYVIEGTKIKLSEAITGIVRVHYLTFS